jgi:FkbM family methyltransferase
MALVSYAQNLEDVMLWRALQHVEKGFYIDVGAYSPDLDSVTKLFYEKGWSGVNIEPEPSCHVEFIQQRLRDINLCFALSNKPSHLEMYFVKDMHQLALNKNTGLSTLDLNIAKQLAAQGYSIQIGKIEAITLANIYERYIPASQEVHFLKIDVEGLEKEVLEGNEWQRYQPWIISIESISPHSHEESYQNWEHLLISAGYFFVYTDRLNRFYISPKHPELRAAFR